MERSNKTRELEEGQKFLSSYCDYSKVDAATANDEAFWVKQKVATKVPPFPATLHMILSDPQNESTITWLPHGRAWKIVNKKEFVKILPRYFRHGQMSSFTRQLRGYGFQKLASGVDVGSYYHERFLRGMPHLCQSIKRSVHKNTTSTEDKKHSPPPDFYQMARENPLLEDPQFETKKGANKVSLNENLETGKIKNASADTNIQSFNRQNSQQEILIEKIASVSANNFKSVPSSMFNITPNHALTSNSYATACPASSPQTSDTNLSLNQCIINTLMNANNSSINSLTPMAEAPISLQQPITNTSREQIDINAVAKLVEILGASTNNIEKKRPRNELFSNPLDYKHPPLCIQPPVSNTYQQPASYEPLNNMLNTNCATHTSAGSALQHNTGTGSLGLLIGEIANILGKQDVRSTNGQLVNPQVPNSQNGNASIIRNTNVPESQSQKDDLILQIIQQLLNANKNLTL